MQAGRFFCGSWLLAVNKAREKKKQKQKPQTSCIFFLAIFVPFLPLKYGWFCRAEFTCIPRAGLVTTTIEARVIFGEECTGCSTRTQTGRAGGWGNAWTCLRTCGRCSHFPKAIRKKQMLSLEHNKLPSVGLRRRFEVERGRTFSLGFTVARRHGGACDWPSGPSAAAPGLIWLLGMEQPRVCPSPPAGRGCSPSSCLPLLRAL